MRRGRCSWYLALGGGGAPSGQYCIAHSCRPKQWKTGSLALVAASTERYHKTAEHCSRVAVCVKLRAGSYVTPASHVVAPRGDRRPLSISACVAPSSNTPPLAIAGDHRPRRRMLFAPLRA
jgi:hypothetical protein